VRKELREGGRIVLTGVSKGGKNVVDIMTTSGRERTSGRADLGNNDPRKRKN